MTRKILIAGLVVLAFVAGSIMTDSAVFAEKKGDEGIIAALTAIVDAITGIEPNVTVNVDPTPVEVNINSEATKNVVSFLSGINPTANCPDGSQISGLTVLEFRVDDFGEIPIRKPIHAGGSFLFDLYYYNVDIEGNDFEITGIGERAGGSSICGLTFTPFTFSITGQCSENTQLDMTTSTGMTISTTGSAACLIVSDPGVGIIAPG